MMGDSILERIRTAFPVGTPRVNRVTAHRCCECDEVDDLLRGRPWTDVASDFPQYCHDAYPLLTDEARIYYLPAFMSHDLQNPGTMAGLSVESALLNSQLSPRSFNREQQEAILLWLHEYHRYDPEGMPSAQFLARWDTE